MNVRSVTPSGHCGAGGASARSIAMRQKARASPKPASSMMRCAGISDCNTELVRTTRACSGALGMKSRARLHQAHQFRADALPLEIGMDIAIGLDAPETMIGDGRVSGELPIRRNDRPGVRLTVEMAPVVADVVRRVFISDAVMQQVQRHHQFNDGANILIHRRAHGETLFECGWHTNLFLFCLSSIVLYQLQCSGARSWSFMIVHAPVLLVWRSCAVRAGTSVSRLSRGGRDGRSGGVARPLAACNCCLRCRATIRSSAVAVTSSSSVSSSAVEGRSPITVAKTS